MDCKFLDSSPLGPLKRDGGSMKKTASKRQKKSFAKKEQNPKFEPTDLISPRAFNGSVEPYMSHERYKLLRESQKRVIHLVLKENKNVFFSGSAGTGKSFLLRFLIDVLILKYGKNAIGVTAPTGLAAVNIQGDTIHSFAGIGSRLSKKSTQQVLNRWFHLRVLIIDEVSMVDASIFSEIDRLARRAKNDSRPFGGIQIIVTGDFYQLPPISDNTIALQYCFHSKSWKETIQEFVIMEENYRQRNDLELINILANLRRGNLNDVEVQKLKSLERCIDDVDGVGPTELFATRAGVEFANNEKLNKLPGDIITFKAIDAGPSKYLKKLDNLLVPEILLLKQNCQVMLLKNKSKNNSIANGSMGVVQYFVTQNFWSLIRDYFTPDQLISEFLVKSIPYFQTNSNNRLQLTYRNDNERDILLKLNQAYHLTRDSNDSYFPIVKFVTARSKFKLQYVGPEFFIVDSVTMSEPVSRYQVPLMLSWAISIHKSQGQTFERVKINASHIFEKGQLYVALSRAVSMDTLELLGFNPDKLIKPSREVSDFYSTI